MVFVGTVFAGTALLAAVGESTTRRWWTARCTAVRGLLLGAVFMATDPHLAVRGPDSGSRIGLRPFTVVIRLYGSYTEGVSFSILLMNLCVPLIERGIRARSFGEVKHRA